MPASWALRQPGMGRPPKGMGMGAPARTHCSKRPSRQSSLLIHSVLAVAATIRKVVITQHVKAITCKRMIMVEFILILKLLNSLRKS